MRKISYTETETAIPDARCEWYIRTVYERAKDPDYTEDSPMLAYVSTENVIRVLEQAVAEGYVDQDRVVVVVKGIEYRFTDRKLPRNFRTKMRDVQEATRAALLEAERQDLQRILDKTSTRG